MSANSIIPRGEFLPSNLILPPEMRDAVPDGDMFDICARVKEVDESLKIAPLVDDPDGYAFAVVEHCRDGIERLVFKVRNLDGRVIEHLRKLMSMPLSERLAAIEKAERRYEAEERERQLDDLYERVGAPMWRDLERCGFSQRPVSYPKRGVKPKTD